MQIGAKLPNRALNEIETRTLRREVKAIAAAARDAGHGPGALMHVLRIVDSADRTDELARQVPAIAAAGIEAVIVDVDWESGEIVGQMEGMRTEVGS